MNKGSRPTTGSNRSCAGCGESLAPKDGPGRPRKWCSSCLPPLTEIGEAEYAARWRELNPEAIARYDAQRRVVAVTAVCTSCGRPFERAPPDRQVCSAFCVRRRRREQERARKTA